MPLLRIRKRTTQPTGSMPSARSPFLVTRSKRVAPDPLPAKHLLTGKTVCFENDGQKMFGKVEAVSADGYATVKLALPDSSGVLLVTDSKTVLPAADLTETSTLATQDVKMRRWELHQTFTIDDGKAAAVKDESGRVVDYLDVVVEGMASTFGDMEDRDRDGDYIMPNAFDETIKEFMRNPVMLTDHENCTDDMAGSFTKVGVIAGKGLFVRGTVTNSPEMKHIRFLIAEGHLKAFSIGGLFLYGGTDGKAIVKIILWEISLVAIPANSNALFSSRSLTLSDVKEASKRAKLTFK